MSEYQTRFKTPKYILFIVAIGYFFIILGVGLLFIPNMIIPGLILIPIGIYLGCSHTGFDIDLEKRRFRYFTSHFWIKDGYWNNLNNYPYLALLSMRTRQTKYSTSGVPISSTDMAYRVHLLNKRHTKKLLIKEFNNEAHARRFMNRISKELNLEIQIYSPDFT
jgi:hypothetical protein